MILKILIRLMHHRLLLLQRARLKQGRVSRQRIWIVGWIRIQILVFITYCVITKTPLLRVCRHHQTIFIIVDIAYHSTSSSTIIGGSSVALVREAEFVVEACESVVAAAYPSRWCLLKLHLPQRSKLLRKTVQTLVPLRQDILVVRIPIMVLSYTAVHYLVMLTIIGFCS